MFKKIINYLSLASLISLITIFTIFFLIDLNIFQLKEKLYKTFPNIELRKIIFKKESKIEHFINDYNVKFLPYTQFEKVNFIKKKIIFENDLISKNNNSSASIAYKKYESFFIDFFQKKLLLTDHNGNVYYIDEKELFSNLKKLNAINIRGDLNPIRVFDSFVHRERIYLSYTTIKENCNTIKVSFAKINFNFLEFKDLFTSNECNETGSPGRMQFLKKENIEGLLLSTSEGIHDKPGTNSQNPNSIFGKIIFIPLEKKLEKEIFSMGHRVIQGLNISNNIIISTEHGPRGGDEINRVIINRNYGWPSVSLGERYDFNYDKKNLDYKKDHAKNNFEEPVFSFIPSIGISEIIKLPETFSLYYNNHYMLSSLNGRSLYFIKFNSDYNKIISLEKIFINKRVRDLKYSKSNNSIVLALEEEGEIGIITKN